MNFAPARLLETLKMPDKNEKTRKHQEYKTMSLFCFISPKH